MSEYDIPVITITREYAAGGRSVAKLLSEKMNIPWYDKDFIKATVNDSGLTEKQLTKVSEEMGDGEKIIDTLFGNGSKYDCVFYAQREVIIKLAKKPCIIIGRASEAILKEANIKAINVYLYSDMEHKIVHAKELNEYGKMSVEKFIQRKDKKRANFYKQYTGKDFTDIHNYDLCLNTAIGYEQCAETIKSFVETMMNKYY